jgi:hypothetical protein
MQARRRIMEQDLWVVTWTILAVDAVLSLFPPVLSSIPVTLVSATNKRTGEIFVVWSKFITSADTLIRKENIMSFWLLVVILVTLIALYWGGGLGIWRGVPNYSWCGALLGILGLILFIVLVIMFINNVNSPAPANTLTRKVQVLLP